MLNKNSCLILTISFVIHVKPVINGSLEMTAQTQKEGFGNCTFTGACAVDCPAEISLSAIAEMNSAYFAAKVRRFLSDKSE